MSGMPKVHYGSSYTYDSILRVGSTVDGRYLESKLWRIIGCYTLVCVVGSSVGRSIHFPGLYCSGRIIFFCFIHESSNLFPFPYFDKRRFETI